MTVAMSTAASWKVFVPYQIFSQEEGILTGKINAEINSIGVYGLKNDHQLVRGELVDCGYWTGEKGVRNISMPFTDTWALITLTESSTPCSKLFIKEGTSFREVSCICIILDKEEICSSYLLEHRKADLRKQELETCNRSFRNQHSVLNFLCDCYAPACRRENGMEGVLSESRTVKKSKYWRYELLSTPIAAIFHVYSLLASILVNRVTQMKYVKFVFDIPLVFHHIKSRSLSFSSIVSSQNTLSYRNLCVSQAVDSLLGMLLMMYLTKGTTTHDLSAVAMSVGETAAVELTSLLNWLMGAPAGLKLNSHLTKFLGHFYLYHVYLWSSYLTVLKPVLSTLLWYSSLVGVLGLSMQLALLQDIFSTFTVHLYCFYVYAARLYSIQLYALKSLLRLFRGKKWNVLRKRVDSASYDVDQLFVGTLLLTILLFLLPTTGLYYIVFTLMRLIILIIHGIVSKVICTLNNFPLYTLLLWFFRSKKVSGDINFTVLQHQPSSKCLLLAMQTTQMSLGELLHSTQKDNQSQPKYTNGDIVKKALVGQLIYPWIDTDN